MVYVLDKDGSPLMPTEKHGYVRRLLKKGKAKAKSLRPFTIRLLGSMIGLKQLSEDRISIEIIQDWYLYQIYNYRKENKADAD